MVSLPALDRCLVDRLEALCLIRSTIAVNRSFFLLPKCSGNPRYFPCPPSFAIPRASLTNTFVSSGVLEEKVTEDLSVLIFCPEANSYSLRILMRAVQLAGEVRQKNIVSSAKSKWFTLGLPRATRIPFKVPSLSAF